MKDFKDIIYEKKGKVGLIIFNRPNNLNALCDNLIKELNQTLDNIEKDDNISVAVITGSEKVFAAGADISEMSNKNFIDLMKNDFILPWEKLSKFRKPVIAAVSGYALGGGCEIAMMCDIIIASENAKFGQPEIKLATIPAAGGTQRLIRSVGKSKAMELVLSGNSLSALEAKQRGLVSKVVPVNILLSSAIDLANKIAENSLPVLILAKEAVNRSFELSLEEGMKNERRLFQSTFSLSDRKEGMKAFLEKRKPKFLNKQLIIKYFFIILKILEIYMANTSSAKKRTRVIERKTKSRDMQKSKIRTMIKTIESSITKKDQKTALDQLKKIDSNLQAAGNKKILTKAKISRIQKRLNSRVVAISKK